MRRNSGRSTIRRLTQLAIVTEFILKTASNFNYVEVRFCSSMHLILSLLYILITDLKGESLVWVNWAELSELCCSSLSCSFPFNLAFDLAEYSGSVMAVFTGSGVVVLDFLHFVLQERKLYALKSIYLFIDGDTSDTNHLNRGCGMNWCGGRC